MALTQIWLQLAKQRSMLAEASGYQDYQEYQQKHGKDVMPENDAEELHRVIREKFGPLYREVSEAIERLQLSDLNDAGPAEPAEQWAELRPVIEAVHPDLMEAYDFMISHELCLRNPAGLSGYTSPLYSTNSALLFTSPRQFLEDDYINMTHEFGHFNNDFHSADHHLYNETWLSVKELYSQGLELLSWHHSDLLFGTEEQEAYRLFMLGRVLGSILDGAVIDQLEREIYADPDRTPEEVRDLYTELYRAYYGEDPQDPWFFTTISHIYEMPFYYMHYATSAMNAFELWDEAFADEAGAVDRYMRASAADIWTPYKELVRECSLQDMQQPANADALADRVRARLAEESARREAVLQPIYDERAAQAQERPAAEAAAEVAAEAPADDPAKKEMQD